MLKVFASSVTEPHAVILVGEAKAWLPELVERAKKLTVSGGFESGADLYAMVSTIP